MATEIELAEADTVSLEDGTELRPDSLRYANGTMVLVTDGREDVVYPGQVYQVESVDRGRGVLEGAGIGVLSGAGAGIMIGLLDGDDDPGQLFAFSATDKAMVFGALFGIMGAGAGSVIGLLMGSTDVYTYPANAPVVSVVPTEGGAQGALSFTF
tara:strand:+ start:17093 stop:17557 length:465 start_codon:yes stop_codon:yes gene_type:complete